MPSSLRHRGEWRVDPAMRGQGDILGAAGDTQPARRDRWPTSTTTWASRRLDRLRVCPYRMRYGRSMSILGDELRRARRRHGITQQSLARRAGTTQAAISRIESGAESPSFERFAQLLLMLGERPTLQSTGLEHDLDPGEVDHARRLTAQQRLAESASWNLVATELEIAGAHARSRRRP